LTAVEEHSTVQLKPVPHCAAIDFRPTRSLREPRVLKGGFEDRRAMIGWDLDHLEAIAGDVTVPVRETLGPPQNIYQNLAPGGRARFGDYVDWVRETAKDLAPLAQKYQHVSDLSRAVRRSGLQTSYYLDVKLKELSTNLYNETSVPYWFGAEPFEANLWLGVLGTSSGLHSDVTPNCNVQMAGSKHFILFAPSQSGRVYRIPAITHCRFDPNEPDYERFPRATTARGWQCRLLPGDALYIPVGWFHQVTVVSGWAANVNYFWRRPFPQGLATPPLWGLLLRRALTRTRVALRERAIPLPAR
jgi:hypothetical protein